MWIMHFESVSGRQMQVRIYNCGDGTLTAGAQPFCLDIDDDDNLFKPVRATTGYMTIVATFDVINTIVGNSATNKSITLFEGYDEYPTDDQILWRGYIKNETYDFEYTPFKQEFQIPIVSRIEYLNTLPVNKTLGYSSVASWIQEFFPNLLGHLYIPDGYYGRLKTYFVNRCNYLTEREYEDADGSMYDADTYGTVMEDICNYFGVQLSECGTDVVFTSVDNCSNYRKFELDNLFATELIYDPVEKQVLDLPQIVSADNSVSILEGKNAVEVEGETNEYETSVFSFNPAKELEYLGTADSANIDQYGYGTKQYRTRKYLNQLGINIQAYQFLAGTTTPTTLNNFKWSNAYDDERTYEGGALANEGIFGEDFESNWTDRIIVTNLTGNNHITPLVVIKPWKLTFRDAQCCIVIKATANCCNDARDVFNGSFSGKIRGYFICNGKYFNETTGWSSSKQPFNLTFDEGNLVTTNHENWYGTQDGYFIGWGDYDTDIANSQFTLQIVAVYGTDGELWNGYVSLEGFTIEAQYDSIWTYGSTDKNGYYKAIGNGAQDSITVTCGLTYPKKAQVGRGCVIDKPWTKRPEIYLGERMVNYYSKSHAMFKIIVHGNDWINPINTINVNGIECAIIGQSLDYRYEELTLTLLSLE